jgi:hypothetical protein
VKVRFLRTTAVLLILAVALIVAYRWMQTHPDPFAGEPVYKGKGLHKWAIDTVDQVPGSLEASEATKAVQAIDPETAVPWLVKWIKPAQDQRDSPTIPHFDPSLSEGAVNCFKIFGSRADAAIPDLNAILKMPEDSFRIAVAKTEAAEALGYLGRNTAPALICAATNPALESLRMSFLNGLGNCSNCPEVIPTLIQWSRDPDEATRYGALRALSRETAQPDLVVPVLRDALKETNDAIRYTVVESLGDFGKAASNAVPDLIKLLDDPKAASRAIYSLGKIGEPSEVIFPVLVKELHDPDWRIRHVSAFALGEFGGQRAFDALMKMTDDPEIRVRRAVFQSLNKIDPQQLKQSGKHF